MLDLKKKVDIKPQEELLVGQCPICSAFVSHRYYMQDKSSGKKSSWFSCSCGIVWNAIKPSKVYDEKYWLEGIKFDQKRKDSFEYLIKLYGPIIEELIYGRRVLIVGRPNTYTEDYFKYRGWVPTVIDKNTSFNSDSSLIASDFEHYQFPENIKYNLIWMYHTLECFSDPVGSLALCKKILAEDGILFIGTPDTDFINTRSNSCFVHWKYDENHIMWNRRSLTRHLDQLGFNVILSRQNYENRFPVWDDCHLVAQKKFF